MNLLQETKDTVAREHGYENWINLLVAFRQYHLSNEKFAAIERKSMHRFAEICCKEQRENDLKNLFEQTKHGDQEHQDWLKNKLNEYINSYD